MDAYSHCLKTQKFMWLHLTELTKLDQIPSHSNKTQNYQDYAKMIESIKTWRRIGRSQWRLISFFFFYIEFQFECLDIFGWVFKYSSIVVNSQVCLRFWMFRQCMQLTSKLLICDAWHISVAICHFMMGLGGKMFQVRLKKIMLLETENWLMYNDH